MTASTNSMRYHHLLQNIPDLMDRRRYPECLYIGANRGRHLLIPEFHAAGIPVDVVEIFPPYIRELDELRKLKGWPRSARLGNILTLDKVVTRQYPLVIHWHGPEHLAFERVPRALRQMEARCLPGGLCLVGLPHGRCTQGTTKDGNTNQQHRHWPSVDAGIGYTPDVFRAAGWEAATLLPESPIPAPNTSHIIAWRRL